LRAFTAYMRARRDWTFDRAMPGLRGQLHFQGGDVSALRFRGDGGYR